MIDELTRVERLYGSVAEYNRSMDEDAAYEQYERELEAASARIIMDAEKKLYDFLVASGFTMKSDIECPVCRDCDTRSYGLRAFSLDSWVFACYNPNCERSSDKHGYNEQLDDEDIPF